MSFYIRVLGAVVLVGLLVSSLFVSMATLQFESILYGMIKDRLVVLVEDVREPFQSVARFGLPISTVRNAQAIMADVQKSDLDISTIYVFDLSGEVVHSTGDNIGSSVSEVELRSISTFDAPVWQSDEGSFFTSIAAIRTASGDAVGGVVIRYPKLGAITQVRSMSAGLAIRAFWILSMFTILSGILLWFVLSNYVKLNDGLIEAFNAFEKQYWRRNGRNPVEFTNIEVLGINNGDFHKSLLKSEEMYHAVGLSNDNRSEEHDI